MKRKKVILSAGGTGGHLFPAQAVADSLKESCDILFVGGLLTKNRFFSQDLFPFQEIHAAPLSVHPKKILKILLGIEQSRTILNEFQPDLVIGFGSYFTFPLLATAFLKKIPIFLHEQNALPGRVNRLFSSYAEATAVSFPKTCQWLRGKNVVEVAFPLRQKQEKRDPWTYFGLEKGRTTLLVFGGSQGARVLNHLVMEMASLLSSEIQIVHFTGNQEFSRSASSFYKKMGLHAVVKEFEERMDYAFRVSDCAITRAGAATIFELIDYEMPAILIPFPQAKDNHQVENARHFVDHVQGGKYLIQDKITPNSLKNSFLQLVEEKEKKRKNISAYKQGRDLKKFSDIIFEYLNKENYGG